MELFVLTASSNVCLSPGYRVSVMDIAIEVPVSYPGARLDMYTA